MLLNLIFQLNINLDKIEALEGKIKAEMVTLKEKMAKMEEDLAVYSDLVWSGFIIPSLTFKANGLLFWTSIILKLYDCS